MTRIQYLDSLTNEDRINVIELLRQEWHRRRRHKVRAATLARRALRSGKIKRRPCEDCGESKKRVEMHHTDYRKPLAVVFLCQLCHRRRHKRKFKDSRCYEPSAFETKGKGKQAMQLAQ